MKCSNCGANCETKKCEYCGTVHDIETINNVTVLIPHIDIKEIDFFTNLNKLNVFKFFNIDI